MRLRVVGAGRQTQIVFMDLTQKVLEALKTAAKQYGFSEQELQGFARELGVNVEDDADDEAQSAAVDAAVKAALPALRLAQATTERRLARQKSKPEPEPKAEPKADATQEDALAKIMAKLEEQSQRIEALQSERVASSRLSQLEAVIKDTGTFGERERKQFARLSFKDDEDFNAYLGEVGESLAAYNKERADAGLGLLGAHPATPSNLTEKAMTDAELSDLADILA